MLAYSTKVTIKLYRHQYEEFMMEFYGDYCIIRESMDIDSLLFRMKYMQKHGISIDKKYRAEFYERSNRLRFMLHVYILALTSKYIEDAAKYIGDILLLDMDADQNYVTFKVQFISSDSNYLERINDLYNCEIFNIYPHKYFRFNTDSYNDGVAKAYPELFKTRQQDKIGTGADKDIFVHSMTFQTSERCSLNCSYCYQFNKSESKMTFETAKDFIDHLLDDDYGYINRYNSPAIIIEFIGGEPLLEITLTRKIYEYFLDRCYEFDHPWFTMHRLSICSNGMQYFDEEVQEFFKDYSSQISFNISIDGNKKLHDSCRVQPNGEGSYDIDMMALHHYNKHFATERNSKMTLAPSNISYLYESVMDFIKHGMTIININCVFEEGWKPEHANIEYEQLKMLADYILANDLEHTYIAIFRDRQEDKMPIEQDGSFCFKAGTQVLTSNGNKNIEDLRIGDKVYTASGNVHRVAKLHHHLSDDNVIVKVSGAFPVYCTSDHKFFAKKFLYTGWKGVKHYSEPGFYSMSELKKGDRIALPILDISKNKPNFITKELAYCIGLYLADGYLDAYHNYNSAIITPGYDVDKKYYNALIAAGLSVYPFKNETTMVYRIGRDKSEVNELFVKICMMCGHRAANKHFPEIIFRSTKEIIAECIRGYVEKDGYQVPIDNSQHGGTIKVNTVSAKMANDLLILLRAIGEYPTCYFYKREGFMYIEGRKVHINDRYEVYYNPIRPNGNRLFKHDDTYGIYWAQIRSIEKDAEAYEVFCPTISPINEDDPEEHTFIANTLAVLNCGGNGSMLALRPNGEFYPCLRYMPSSVGSDRDSMCIGTVQDGMDSRENGSEVLRKLDRITRRGQNTDICFECPLSNVCASCLALGHTVFNNPNKRTTFTCIMVIAESLSNVYYWNNMIVKHPDWDIHPRRLVVPDEWALLVIDQDELDLLKNLELLAMVTYMENHKK